MNAVATGTRYKVVEVADPRIVSRSGPVTERDYGHYRFETWADAYNFAQNVNAKRRAQNNGRNPMKYLKTAPE